MSSFTKTTKSECIIDEFGRDNSLRKQKTQAPCVTSMCGDYFNRFKGMSWAEITYLLEEEEEEELKKQEEELKKKDAERKRKCETTSTYELEEGEIFE